MRQAVAIFTFIFIAIAVSAAPLMTGITDNSSPLLDYAGAWTDGVEALAYGSSITETTDSSATLTFEAYSDGFTTFFITDPSGASVDVCIDGECTSVPTQGATAQSKAEFTNLPSGLKEVTIQKNTVDSNPFKFDAVYIHPEQIQERANELTRQFTYDGTDYSGVHDLRITSGDVALVRVSVFIAIVLIAQFLWSVVKS